MVAAIPGWLFIPTPTTEILAIFSSVVKGLLMAAAHADKDLVGRANSAAIVMTGHTHVARIDFDFGCIHLNPGHLKAARDRGQAPSFATITTSPLQIECAIHEFNGDIRTSLTALRSDLRKDEE